MPLCLSSALARPLLRPVRGRFLLAPSRARDRAGRPASASSRALSPALARPVLSPYRGRILLAPLLHLAHAPAAPPRARDHAGRPAGLSQLALASASRSFPPVPASGPRSLPAHSILRSRVRRPAAFSQLPLRPPPARSSPWVQPAPASGPPPLPARSIPPS
ncbi:hypothetical protein OH77DRAFT_1526052 [Trametes cingulata]|nr:hypothetical protein OH77DRAFT_1526052 [Trametes cingulata]